MSSFNLLILVAVRMESTRLKKKALIDLNGKPMLLCLVERLMERFDKNQIVLCTSNFAGDNPIAEFAKSYDLLCYRGDELDVMKRFIDAAQRYDANTIARVTGDNPLTDPNLLEYMFLCHEREESEYTYNDDLPVGTRAEIIDVTALKRIYEQLSDPSYSEYMTYMLKRPDKMRIFRVEAPSKLLKRPEISLTVDTSLDLELVRDIYAHFKEGLPSLEVIIKWLDEVPEKKIIADTIPSILPKDINCSFRDDDLL